jgi:hypothetical protein
MSLETAKANKWTCDGCAVSISQIDGRSTALPDTWVSSEQGMFCLVCQRALAADAALDSAPTDSSLEARAKLRRAAVIEFEIRRTPDHTNGVIAKACRSSATAVARARDRLQLPEPARAHKAPSRQSGGR